MDEEIGEIRALREQVTQIARAQLVEACTKADARSIGPTMRMSAWWNVLRDCREKDVEYLRYLILRGNDFDA